MNERNVCTYKQVCRKCAVEVSERPSLCTAMECPSYTPCVKCHRNVGINSEGICGWCRDAKGGKITAEIDKDEIPLETENADSIHNLPQAFDPNQMSVPGVPPAYLTDSQREYYTLQWQEYSGYYRDPTAYTICHFIILEEINLNYITQRVMSREGTARDQLNKMKQQSISNLKDLRAQLPEKEAMELSDDEKYFAMIADAYIEQKQLQTCGSISRVFTDEAIALAPALPHPVDINYLLKTAGYRLADLDAVEIAPKIDATEKSPQEVLEFFGYHLREKFAIGDDMDLNELEEDIDDSGEPTEFA